MPLPALPERIRRGFLALVAIVLSPACRRGEAPPEDPPLVSSLLTVAAEVAPTTREEQTWARSELRQIASMVAARAQQETPPPSGDATILALREVVFGTLRFEREVEDTSLKFVVLPSVLRARRGNCVGLGTLYLALGELIGRRMEGVLRPGHFYVRTVDERTHRNVELLHQGEEMPDEWYPQRFPAPAESEGTFGRGLSTVEVMGVVEYDAGNEWRRQGRLSDARSAYAHATQHFPTLAEAHAGLGAVLQLQGALDQAEQSYRMAWRLNPNLAGVAWNLRLLEAEREGGDAGR